MVHHILYYILFRQVHWRPFPKAFLQIINICTIYIHIYTFTIISGIDTERRHIFISLCDGTGVKCWNNMEYIFIPHFVLVSFGCDTGRPFELMKLTITKNNPPLSLWGPESKIGSESSPFLNCSHLYLNLYT